MANPSVEAAKLENRLILVAEDNESNRKLMLKQLALLGYATESAEDGVVALQLWRNGRHALLLTDCNMPNMNGFDLTAAIRREELEGTRLPIIAVTANAMQGDCLNRGMDGYLSKPYKMHELKAILTTWMP